MALHAKAKAEAGYRFYALYDKISRDDILAHAYAQCRSNKGAPGIDGQDFADIEAYGVERWLAELALALRQETYRPEPIRRVFIPKANGTLRPLGISNVRDRVCMTAATLVLDIAKHVFHLHGADAAGHVLFRKRITRAKLLGFLAAQARCVVAMEACAGAHYWAREIAKLGHHVRLIAPVYVKPFIKRQKNDAADAEAICEAAQRPSMRFVPVKTEEQQANGIVFRARDLLVRQRTQCVNALRGHLMEYGYVFPKGITHVETLVAVVEDLQSSLPDGVRTILKLLVDTFTALEAQIATLDTEINRRSKSDPTARRLMTIPGVGPIV